MEIRRKSRSCKVQDKHQLFNIINGRAYKPGQSGEYAGRGEWSLLGQVSNRTVIDLTISALRKELVESLPYNITSHDCELTLDLYKLCVCIVGH